METFLKQVAHDLYNKTEGNFTKVAIVFPNKRASLFFNEYLAQESDRPIWSPTYVSISELFRQSSDLSIADPIKLVCDLYKVFQKATGSKETLDDFYFWGEMLIADFDDADKNMADTHALFSNLKDLNELMDNYDFLEEGQKEALSQFFHNFSINQVTELKQRFISMWNVLGDIYAEYKALLESQSIAYEGMLYRQVIEQLDVEALPYNKYIFVGFNVLNKVEHTLFKKLNEAGKAMFYWDYDTFYLNKTPHEAGEFIRRNLRDFPSELPASFFDNLNQPKEVTFIESPTENGQVRYLPQWIRENLTSQEKETAVVLCNEALLQPVLHALPDNVKHINITMGFPLSQTPAYSFVNALMELHTSGYNPNNGRYLFAEVISVLKHPYTRQLSPEAEKLEQTLTRDNRFYPLPSELKQDNVLELLFTPRRNNLDLCSMLSEALKEVAVIYQQQAASHSDAFDQLYRESLFKTYTLVNRFHTLIESKELNVQAGTFQRLLTRVMSSSSIPFHGEPAIGMQVMGVLETRNLDFRHLIMLSVNEGQLPKAGGDSSFIPYNLRKAFGMTTIDHKIAVYAYYFYRLMQRAEKVTLVYNTATDGINRGELSRFMLQFLIEWGYPVLRKQLEAAQSPQDSTPIIIEKTPDIMERMKSVFDIRNNPKALISPSALNCYLDCPLKFYYKYVALLSAPDEVTADIDSAKFGSIFHYAAEHIYKDLTAHGKLISKENLETLLKDEVRLQTYVDNGFKELFFNLPPNEQPEYNGIQLINSAVIVKYIQQLLRNDLRYAPFTFIGSEQRIFENIEICTSTGDIQSRIGGIIDRIDSKGESLRIVDYKTGGDADTPANVQSLFIPDKKRSNYVFQTFLYASIVCKKLREKNDSRLVAPALLYIHRAASEKYSPVIQMGEPRKPKEPVDNFAQYEGDFRENLKTLLEDIFNPDISFTQTEIEDKCAYCDFRALCKK
ncbi:PD-(D/E)XK nuclease family protein [Phocaeicola coprocola]|nr:PD-(D/E)XK nuclease family protein [Phocaeicola coprocola]MBS4814512.1 PD-(D/E)XK nuclease family protein [Bacteroides sp.]HCM09802.1 PD-(D/E)XK nuclease family protein [Bacteroides sp.]